MKASKTLVLFPLVALTMVACVYDDSDLWEQVTQNTEELAAQAARIAALEAWQAETNTNIQSLQTLLNTTDYITAVTPIVQEGEEVGFTISFLNTPAITIYHGEKGDTPQISVTQLDDDNWYWTLNGELLTDAQDNPIQANGMKGDDAPLPQLATGTKLTEQGVTTDTQNNAIKPEAFYLSVDGGATWTRVSGVDGDSFFQGVDITNADYITFTLANDGGSFAVPRYVGISLTLESNVTTWFYGISVTITCQTDNNSLYTADNLYLIAVPDGWKAVINDDLTITVTAPADETSGAIEGEILVMLDNKKGNTTIGRIPVSCGTTLTVGNLQPGELATLIGQLTNLPSITVTSGEINDDDWNAIRNNEWGLQTIDLAGATYHTNGLVYVKDTYAASVPLTTVKLPQGVTGFGDRAFIECRNLSSVDLPDGLTSIGWNAFFNCSKLTSINIPDEVTSIEGYAFYGCTSLNLVICRATMPPALNDTAFVRCKALTAIQVPAESVNAYKGADIWSTYEDIIVAITEP